MILQSKPAGQSMMSSSQAPSPVHFRSQSLLLLLQVVQTLGLLGGH
jgi:hypothetical protein